MSDDGSVSELSEAEERDDVEGYDDIDDGAAELSTSRSAVLDDVKAYFYEGDWTPDEQVDSIDERSTVGEPSDGEQPDADLPDADLPDKELSDEESPDAELPDEGWIIDESFIEESWFDLEGIDVDGTGEWTWVNEPYAFVCIQFDADEREYRYQVVEPTMDTFEQYVLEDVATVVRSSLLKLDVDEDDDREAVFREHVERLMDEHAATVDEGTLRKVLYYLLRDFLHFGPIDPIMRDRDIEDISCDGSEVPVYVYHREYRDLQTNVSFERQRLNSFTVRMAQRAGKQLSVSDPLVDASLPDGSRVQLTFGGEVATRGSNFTIRKFADIPYTPVDLLNWNTFSVEQMAYFWLAIENNRSLIFAGGTGSGKTTSMNAVSFFIPPASKVVSIEDTREIDLPHDNWVQSVTRSSASGEGRGEVSTYDLLQAALRQRPEYLIVGEIRTEQKVALTFFQAMGTGHTAYTTIHADSVESALSRLENPPLSIPAQMLQDLDILNIQQQIYVGERRLRRNRTVAELYADESDPNSIDSTDVYRWDPKSDSHELVADSRVLADIASDRGWTDADLADELSARESLLTYLLENDIYDYEAVAAAIHLFQKDPGYVLDQLEDDSFDPAALVESKTDTLHDEVVGEEPPTPGLDEDTWETVVRGAGDFDDGIDQDDSDARAAPDAPDARDATVALDESDPADGTDVDVGTGGTTASRVSDDEGSGGGTDRIDEETPTDGGEDGDDGNEEPGR